MRALISRFLNSLKSNTEPSPAILLDIRTVPDITVLSMPEVISAEDKKILDLRLDFLHGATYDDLVAKYGFWRSQVSQIIRYKTYGHVAADLQLMCMNLAETRRKMLAARSTHKARSYWVNKKKNGNYYANCVDLS